MLTLELVLALPILLLVVLAAIEFSILLMGNQAISAAAAIGAREASMPGATPQRVQAAVQKALKPWRFAGKIEPLVLEPPFPAQVPSGQPVSVTVRVRSLDVAPDLLKFVGVSLAGQKLSSKYVARKE
ncbi:MAG: pilus assembly protein [Pirellulales bacterium]|nr:pilus assembly protein [Pirellulales bacterium]